jgi:hypothetical protein
MADLIAYTDLATYLGVTFNTTPPVNEQTTATLCCSAASDLIKGTANRSFEIQGAASDRTFTFKRLYGPYGPYGLNLDYYGAIDWGVIYPSLLAGYAVPQLEVDDFFLTGQTIGQITVTNFTTSATYVPNRGWPYNAATIGDPFTRLEFPANTALPTGDGQLVVNAKWGYVTSIPAGLKGAALLQASRFFKRKDAPFGIAGTDGMGNALRLQARLDPDVEEIVNSYRRWWGAV